MLNLTLLQTQSISGVKYNNSYGKKSFDETEPKPEKKFKLSLIKMKSKN